MALLFAKNNSLSAVTALPAAVSGGGLNLISTQTASSSATIDFTSGIDSTYKEYIFKFINIHPSGDGSNGVFQFQGDSGTNTNYNQTITSTYFIAYHNENGSEQSLGYSAGGDQAQGTAFQYLGSGDNQSDSGISGYLHLFNPSSTIFAKHFFGQTINDPSSYAQVEYLSGYFNTTTAITRIRFKMASGNIDAGTIKMYGVT